MSRPLRIEYPGAYYHVMNRMKGAYHFLAGWNQLILSNTLALLQHWGCEHLQFKCN